MSKRVDIGTRPTTRQAGPAPDANAWIANQEQSEPERIKRLTIDLPESLHRRIKVACVLEGVTIVEVVRERAAHQAIPAGLMCGTT